MEELIERFKEVVFDVNRQWYGEEQALEAINDNLSVENIENNLRTILENAHQHRDSILEFVSELEKEETSPQQQMMIELYHLVLDHLE